MLLKLASSTACGVGLVGTRICQDTNQQGSIDGYDTLFVRVWQGRALGRVCIEKFCRRQRYTSLFEAISCLALTVVQSASTETGMARLSLSDPDKQARDWFAKTVQDLGCVVTTDAMGNQFAVRKGLHDGAPTNAGSHLDTQPTVCCCHLVVSWC